jgi:hypothetical protein
MKPILDSEKRAKIVTVLTLGGTFALAAQHVGCSRVTIFRTAKRDPDFRKELDNAMASTEIQFLQTIQAAGKDNWQAAKWALQHMHPDRYARKAFTMSLADVKDLISQLLDAIAEVIRDPATRAAVRRRIRKLTDSAIRQAKERARDT